MKLAIECYSRRTHSCLTSSPAVPLSTIRRSDNSSFCTWHCDRVGLFTQRYWIIDIGPKTRLRASRRYKYTRNNPAALSHEIDNQLCRILNSRSWVYGIFPEKIFLVVLWRVCRGQPKERKEQVVDSARLSGVYPKRVTCRYDLCLFVCTVVKMVLVKFLREPTYGDSLRGRWICRGLYGRRFEERGGDSDIIGGYQSQVWQRDKMIDSWMSERLCLNIDAEDWASKFRVARWW